MSMKIAMALAATLGAAVLAAPAAQARPEMVGIRGDYTPGTIVVKTSERRLYLILDSGRAMRYPVGVGRSGNTDGEATGLQHGKGLLQVRAAKGVDNKVVAGQHLGEVRRGVVDDDVGPEVPDQVHRGRICRCRHGGAEVPCQLDDRRAEAACSGVDKHLLTGQQVCPLHEDLPGGQRDQRDGGGLL